MKKLFGAHSADQQRPSQRIVEIKMTDFSSHQMVAVNLKHEIMAYMNKPEDIRREAHEKLDALMDRILPV
jgi:hypothetical protein